MCGCEATFDERRCPEGAVSVERARVVRHTMLSRSLASLTDHEVVSLLDGSERLGVGIGGSTTAGTLAIGSAGTSSSWSIGLFIAALQKAKARQCDPVTGFRSRDCRESPLRKISRAGYGF